MTLQIIIASVSIWFDLNDCSHWQYITISHTESTVLSEELQIHYIKQLKSQVYFPRYPKHYNQVIVQCLKNLYSLKCNPTCDHWELNSNRMYTSIIFSLEYRRFNVIRLILNFVVTPNVHQYPTNAELALTLRSQIHNKNISFFDPSIGVLHASISIQCIWKPASCVVYSGKLWIINMSITMIYSRTLFCQVWMCRDKPPVPGKCLYLYYVLTYLW